MLEKPDPRLDHDTLVSIFPTLFPPRLVRQRAIPNAFPYFDHYYNPQKQAILDLMTIPEIQTIVLDYQQVIAGNQTEVELYSRLASAYLGQIFYGQAENFFIAVSGLVDCSLICDANGHLWPFDLPSIMPDIVEATPKAINSPGFKGFVVKPKDNSVEYLAVSDPGRNAALGTYLSHLPDLARTNLSLSVFTHLSHQYEALAG